MSSARGKERRFTTKRYCLACKAMRHPQPDDRYVCKHCGHLLIMWTKEDVQPSGTNSS